MFTSRSSRHLTLLVATFAVVACSSPDVPAGPAPVPDRIVLVTIDTLRADQMGAFGYIRDTTPFLDSLAERGTLFTRAFSQSGTTQPSHASLFTGMYPLQHNVRRNGEMLDEAFLTMAEFLRERGFRTAAFTGTSAHFQWGGLSQGFDVYDELALPDGAVRQNTRTRNESLYRAGNETIDRALEWLADVDAEESFFLWVHLFDPHAPLMPPVDYLAEMTPRDVASEHEFIEFLREERSIDAADKPNLLSRIIKYDAEIAFTDAQLERFFEYLEGRGMNRDSMWIVTADHGQGLGTHEGFFGHAQQIYNVQLHVPLIVYFDPPWRPETVDDTLIEHVDVLPTLADIFDADLNEQVFAVQGVSLLPLMAGQRNAYSKEFIFGQSSDYPQRRRGGERNVLYSLQSQRYKYLLFNFGGDEFYDLSRDPYEQTNLIADESAEQLRMKQRLEEIIESLNNEAPSMSVDEATLERLRALGYLR